MTIKKIKLIIIIFSTLLYVASLTQNAVIYDDYDGQKTHSALALLFMGGISILGGGLFEWLIWLANPLFFIAVILFAKENRNSIYLAATATLIALSFSTWTELLAAENGRIALISSIKIGYWLWVASMTFLTAGAFYYFKLKNQ